MAPDPATAVNAKSPADRLGNRFLTGGLLALLLILVGRDLEIVLESLRTHGLPILLWIALVGTTNLFPVHVGHTQLTLDIPLLLAVGILFGPSVAAFVAVLGAIDARELRGGISLVRAVFNRVQVALSVYFASLAFHSLNPSSLRDPVEAGLAMVIALVVDYVVNVGLVAAYLNLRNESRRLSQLRIGPVWQFITTYLGYGAMALVLANLSTTPGYWSVLILLVPILLAREAFARWQDAASASRRLQRLEQLATRMNARLLDERRSERLTVAAELHDETLQNLVAVWLSSRRVRSLLEAEPMPAATAEEVAALVQASDEAMSSLRRVILGLRSSPLGQRGLVESIEHLVRELDSGTRPSIRVHYGEDLETLPPDSQFLVFVILREALLNAARHSRARHVDLSLTRLESSIGIAVVDDGCGFDSSLVDPESHFGLQLLEERIRTCGGELSLVTQPGKGTSLRATLPLGGPPEKSEPSWTSYASALHPREPVPRQS